MRAFVVLGFVFSAPSQEIGLGKRLRSDLFCFECDVKPQLSQSIKSVGFVVGPSHLSRRCVDHWFTGCRRFLLFRDADSGRYADECVSECVDLYSA